MVLLNKIKRHFAAFARRQLLRVLIISSAILKATIAICALTYGERTEIIRKKAKQQEQQSKTFQGMFIPKNNISEASL